jgi:hypothetical protein
MEQGTGTCLRLPARGRGSVIPVGAQHRERAEAADRGPRNITDYVHFLLTVDESLAFPSSRQTLNVSVLIEVP